MTDTATAYAAIDVDPRDMTSAQNIRLALVQDVIRVEGFVPEPDQLIAAIDSVAKWIIDGQVAAK